MQLHHKNASGLIMQGHTYTLVGIFAADGLAGLFVPVLWVGLTCTCVKDC